MVGLLCTPLNDWSLPMLVKKEIKEESFNITSNLDDMLDRSTLLYRWYRRTMDDLLRTFQGHPCKNEARILTNLAFYLLKFVFDLAKVPSNQVNNVRNILVSAIPQLFNIEKRIRELLKGILDSEDMGNVSDMSGMPVDLMKGSRLHDRIYEN